MNLDRVKLRLGLILLFSSVGLLAALALPTWAVSTPSPAALNKIDPWVLDHTAASQSAEFLVMLSDQADLSGAAKFTTKLAKGRYVYQTLWQKAQETQKPIVQWLADRGVEFRPYYIVNVIWVKGNRSIALALANRSDVKKIEGNPQIKLAPDPASNLGAPQAIDSIEPGISYVNAPQVWDMGFTGQGIVVGGQDTGYQWDHPALKNQYRGWNSATLTVTHDYNWHDAIHAVGSNCGADSPFPCDDYGHGTHTMGTAVGSDGGANQIGMAPGAKWIGCRNMNEGYGSPTTYLECFEFFLAPYPITGTAALGNPDLAPDVTNNSWTCPPSEGCAVDSLLAAVQAQRAAGIMTVVSAGNSGSSCSTISDPPSYHAEVYTVGALNTGSDSIASFSSRGPVARDGSNRRKPDISAPGTGTRSAVPGNGYGYMSGTSMAAPHVAGAIALLWSARPLLKNNIDLTEQLLNDSAFHISNSTCDTPGTTWPNNTYGYGRLNIKAAVDSAPTTTGLLTGSVRDAATAAPISSASVSAMLSQTLTAHSTTNQNGGYVLPVDSGVYTVSVTAYGYEPATLTDITVLSGTTTTRDITLTATSFYTVSGYVTDALLGTPLTATLIITGYPGSPISTQVDGAYSVSLAAGITYPFQAEAKVGGYLIVSRTVGPLISDRVEDFNLPPDLVACSAPGYVRYGIGEMFNATITPTNWTISSTVENIGWRFDNPGGRQNFTGGLGNFATADSEYFGPGPVVNSELRTPALNFSMLPTVTLNFKTDFSATVGSSATVADVDISLNGAYGPWINVWRKTSAYRGPHTESIDLTPLAARQSRLVARFSYQNAVNDGWWQIDDVQLGYCALPGFRPSYQFYLPLIRSDS